MTTRITRRFVPSLIATLACVLLSSGIAPRQTTPAARQTPAWLRDGIIYELFPRNFSSEGNFNGVTAKLDELKDLGVTIIWLMPVHPIGEKFRKGSFGSHYAV